MSKLKVKNNLLVFRNSMKAWEGLNRLFLFNIPGLDIERIGMDYPMITVFMRASEVTKRLICDLLLIQRIGEYIFTGDKFCISIHFSQIFNDDTVLLMYHAHEDLLKLSDRIGIYDSNWYDRLKYLLKVDPDKIKYKVHKRALKVLRPELFKYPKTLAKDCTLGNEDWLPF